LIYVLVGTVDQMVADLEARRERWGHLLHHDARAVHGRTRPSRRAARRRLAQRVLAFGWRLVFAVFALVLALVTIPLAALLYRNAPGKRAHKHLRDVLA